MLLTLRALLNLVGFIYAGRESYKWFRHRYSKNAKMQRNSLKVYKKIIKFPMSRFTWTSPQVLQILDDELKLLLTGPATATVYDEDGKELYSSNLTLQFPVPLGFKGWDASRANVAAETLIDAIASAKISTIELAIHGSKLQSLQINTDDEGDPTNLTGITIKYS